MRLVSGEIRTFRMHLMHNRLNIVSRFNVLFVLQTFLKVFLLLFSLVKP